MTREQLKTANEMMEQIQKLEKFIKAFKGPYMKDIRAAAFGENGRDCTSRMIISPDSELHSFILSHYDSELRRLEKEFQNL